MAGLPFLSVPMPTIKLFLSVNSIKREVHIHFTQTQLIEKTRESLLATKALILYSALQLQSHVRHRKLG